MGNHPFLQQKQIKYVLFHMHTIISDPIANCELGFVYLLIADRTRTLEIKFKGVIPCADNFIHFYIISFPDILS